MLLLHLVLGAIRRSRELSLVQQGEGVSRALLGDVGAGRCRHSSSFVPGVRLPGCSPRLCFCTDFVHSEVFPSVLYVLQRPLLCCAGGDRKAPVAGLLRGLWVCGWVVQGATCSHLYFREFQSSCTGRATPSPPYGQEESGGCPDPALQLLSGCVWDLARLQWGVRGPLCLGTPRSS